MSTITKKELVDRIARITDVKQALVKPVIQSFHDEIISELAKDNSAGPGQMMNSSLRRRVCALL